MRKLVFGAFVSGFLLGACGGEAPPGAGPNASAPAGTPRPVEEHAFQVSGPPLMREEIVDGSSIRLVHSPGGPTAPARG